MIRPELLEILRCPESHQRLTVADLALLTEVNARIAAHKLRNRAGKTLEEPLEAALVVADGTLVYPVRGNLPILLVDEAIPIREA